MHHSVLDTNYVYLPQVDSTNKFSEDLPGEHEHGPGGQVESNNNAHSARAHHVLGDLHTR